jgi:DNA-binding response OmpR family regulator
MTSSEFVETELIKRNTSEKDIKDILEIFKKAIGIESGYSPKDRLVIDKSKYAIYIDGVLQPSLPKKIFRLIDLFKENEGKLLSRDRLLEEVWPDVVVGQRTIDVHIVYVRNILGKKSIDTIKGMGYRFNGI